MLKPLSNIIKEVNISRIFEQNINILSDIDDTDELTNVEIQPKNINSKIAIREQMRKIMKLQLELCFIDYRVLPDKAINDLNTHIDLYESLIQVDNNQLKKYIARFIDRYEWRKLKNFNWLDTSLVTDMSGLFYENEFCAGIDISRWNVSNVKNMSHMFAISSFDGDISNWDVSNVTAMNSMFECCKAFNSDIGNWDVSNVMFMTYMFQSAENFNQDISKWEIRTQRIFGMFDRCRIQKHNMPKILQKRYLLENNVYLLSDIDDDNIDNIDISTKSVNNLLDGSVAIQRKKAKELLEGLLDTGERFAAVLSKINNDPDNSDELQIIKDINNENNFELYKSLIVATSKEHLQTLIFLGRHIFGEDGNFNWIDTSKITDMHRLFGNNITNDFNGHIELWDVSNVTDMAYMFASLVKFNQDISNWDVSNVTDMTLMFWQAELFNQPIGKWNVSNVNSMYGMFKNAESFNKPIGRWNVFNVIDMTYMFEDAKTFNQPLNDWDTSNVMDMNHMFAGAEQFNQPLHKWDVRKVRDMRHMFYRAKSFNQDISNWQIYIPFKYYTENMFSFCPIQNEYKPYT